MKEAAKSSFNVISVWPQDESNVAGRVILSNVTVDAEGTYKCEVSTEAPIFDTDSKESNLTVISKLRMLPADASGGCFRRKRVTHFICFSLGLIYVADFNWLVASRLYLKRKAFPVTSTWPEVNCSLNLPGRLGLIPSSHAPRSPDISTHFNPQIVTLSNISRKDRISIGHRSRFSGARRRLSVVRL